MLRVYSIHIIFLVFFLSLSACTNNSDDSGSKTEERFSLTSSSGISYKLRQEQIAIKEINQVGLTRPEEWAASYLVNNSILLDEPDEFTIIGLSSGQVSNEFVGFLFARIKANGKGVFSNEQIVEVRLLDAKNNLEYVVEENFKNTSAKVSFTQYDQVGGYIKGDFEFLLCLQDALLRAKCEHEENQLTLTGDFSIIRDKDLALAQQGRIDSPFDLGSAPINPANQLMVAKDQTSYYRVELPRSFSQYYISPRVISGDAKISIYSDNEFSDLLCETDQIENPNNEVDHYLNLDNACVIDNANAYTELFFQAEYNDNDINFLILRLDVIALDTFQYEGTTEVPIGVGDAGQEKLVFSGQAGAAFEHDDNEKNKSIYSAKVEERTPYVLAVSYFSNTDFSATVYDDEKNILCSIRGYIAYSCVLASNSKNISIEIERLGQLMDFGIAYELTLDKTDDSYFPSQGSRESPKELLVSESNTLVSGSVNSLPSFYVVEVQELQPIEFEFIPRGGVIQLKFYDNSNFSDDLVCSLKIADRTCNIQSNNGDGKVYIEVIPSVLSSGAFDLNIKQTDFVLVNESDVELNSSNNLFLTPMNYQVGRETSEYTLYVEPGVATTVTLSEMSNWRMDFIVSGYHESNFRKTLCEGGFETLYSSSCIFISDRDQVTITVTGYATAAGGTFQFVVNQGGQYFTSEGSIRDPIILDGDLPIVSPNRSVGLNSTSYYSVTLAPDTTYEITISDITDQQIYAYILRVNGGFDSWCVQYSEGKSQISCQITTTIDDTEVLIRIRGDNTANGSAYTISIEEDE